MKKPNITVLDGYTLNPGDLSWEGLHALGNTTIYERTAPEQIVERAGHSEIVLTNKTPLRKETLEQLPNLKYIGVLATGYDVVDVKAAAEQQIVVTHIPSYGTDSVAQFVFALLLELCHRTGLHDTSVKQGDWSRSKDFCYWKAPLIELAGKTFGIVGLGRIGMRTAEIAKAFGMNVVAFSRSMDQTPPDGIQWMELNELLAVSDVVSLHCPLTPETEGFINRSALSRMKPSAFLINTARGKLLNEQDVADALNEGRLAGAALDVLAVEPPDGTSPLLTARNCIITPHLAWATQEARSRLLKTAIENIQAYIDQRPMNVVNKPTP